MRFDRAQLRHRDRAVLADAAEVVAREVDDHHVLGAVLLAPGEGRAVDRGALDRTRHHAVAVDTEEQLGRRGDDGQGGRCGTERAERGVRRRVPAGRARSTAPTGSAASAASSLPGEVHLVALARVEQLEDGLHRVAVRRPVETTTSKWSSPRARGCLARAQRAPRGLREQRRGGPSPSMTRFLARRRTHHARRSGRARGRGGEGRRRPAARTRSTWRPRS